MLAVVTRRSLGPSVSRKRGKREMEELMLCNKRGCGSQADSGAKVICRVTTKKLAKSIALKCG